MEIEALRYKLRPQNIQGTPREIRLGRRDLARMLVVNRSDGSLLDSMVRALPHLLRPNDVLVLNNSKRIPGVLKGRTAVGGAVELRFVDLGDEDGTGLCRIFPMHDVTLGSTLTCVDGVQVRVLEVGLTKYELARVTAVGIPLRTLLKRSGLPISGFFYEGNWSPDHLNPYYATEEGTVESPLAGLHFTPELIDAVKRAGVAIEFVTLHSVGSWLPFLERDIEQHEMWPEAFRVSDSTATAINRAKKHGGRVIACGSTSMRALESCAVQDGCVQATSGRTQLYVTPGYRFKVVEGYFTNFHQYQTSLIVLDAAFATPALVRSAYRSASRMDYAFYEFGDAVLYL
jgi:S-adenosylmethionine:tRNA ribosyltransferase-isomerase